MAINHLHAPKLRKMIILYGDLFDKLMIDATLRDTYHVIKARKKPISTTELADTTHVTAKTALKRLRKLESLGYIESFHKTVYICYRPSKVCMWQVKK